MNPAPFLILKLKNLSASQQIYRPSSLKNLRFSSKTGIWYSEKDDMPINMESVLNYDTIILLMQ